MLIWRPRTFSCNVHFTYLFVKFDEGWLVKLLNVIAHVVGILHVTNAFAHISFIWQEVLLQLSWQGMEWYNDVSSISYLLELDMRYFLVVHHCWVMGGHVSGKFWEVGCHILFNL